MSLSIVPRLRQRSGRNYLVLACLAVLAAVLGVLAAPQGTVSAAVKPPLAWSGQRPLEQAPFQYDTDLDAIDCPTAQFCVAADANSDVVRSADPAGGPATWSAPVLARNLLSQISCPTTSFCAGVGPAGIDTSVPAPGKTGWQVSYGFALPAYSISCPTTKLCVMATPGGVYFSADPTAPRAKWHATILSKYPGLRSISCPSASFCAAVGTKGNLVTSARPAGGKTDWTTTDIDATVSMFDVTCSSDRFCLALDSLGRILYSTDPAGGASQWHRASAPADLSDVTCESASLCLGINGTEVVSSASPAKGASAWQGTSPFGADIPVGLSCVRDFCAAVADGDVATSENAEAASPTWTVAANVDGETDIGVDCPSTSLCVAGDGLGRVWVSADPAGGPSAWSAAQVDGSNDISDMDCPTPSFCAALDDDNQIVTATNPAGGASAWHVASVPADSLHDLDCVTSSLCLASDFDNDLWYTADPGGGASAWMEISLGIGQVSGGLGPFACPSTHLCVAAGYTNESIPTLFVSTDPTGGASAWQATTFGKLGDISELACPSATLCIATGNLSGADGNSGPTVDLTSTDPTGGMAAWHVTTGPAGELDCPNASTCYMFDPSTENSTGVSNTMLTTTNPSAAAPTWHPSPAPGNLLTVSCPAVSLCVGTYIGRYHGAGIEYGVAGLAATTTSLGLSAERIVHGQENRERLSITVKALYGVPSGEAVIAAGKTTVCTLTLRSGKASCTLRARQLKAGSYQLQARYSGSSIFATSRSATSRLTVAG